jgi:hypothetical protein
LKGWIRKYSANKFTVVAVAAVDRSSSEKTIEAYVSAQKIDYPTAIVDGDTIQRLQTRFYPHALLVDAKGIVRWAGFPGELPDWILDRVIKGDAK